MKTSKGFVPFALVLIGQLLSPVLVAAQRGDNAVYTTGNSLAPSPAWIDAAAFCGSGGGSGSCGVSGTDVCTMISTALGSLPTTGGVIDARGVVPPNGGGQACPTTLPNPFSGVTAPNNVPITVLLPASTIGITGSWVLPNNTHLIGEGGFTILAKFTNCCSGAMVQMGSSSICPSIGGVPVCSGISVEHLKLQGDSGTAFGGIDNEYAQSASYVNDVGMVDFDGTGLKVGAGASNSGPYTNLAFTANSGDACTSHSNAPTCVDLETRTAGLHGITCLGNSATTSTHGAAGILVNSSNNSVEDVHVESFWDGIEIGDTTSAVSNVVVSNVFTSTSGACSPNAHQTTNAVHICGPNANDSTDFGQCNNFGTNTGNVTDITLMGITNLVAGTTSPVTSIEDDQTFTTMQGCSSTGCPAVISTGMYGLGEPDGGNTGQFSRLATTPSSASLYGGHSTVVPTWGAGTTASLGGTECYTPGALYSYTATMVNDSVYLCTFSGSSMAWTAIP